MPHHKARALRFEIKYEGAFDDKLNVFTFLDSLNGFCSAIRGIKESLFPDSDLAIGIKQTHPGSFLVDLIATIAIANTLFSDGSQLVEIFKTFWELLDLLKFLEGEPPLEVKAEPGSTVIVINGKGNSLAVGNTTYETYANNAYVGKCISKAFQTLELDQEVEKVSLIAQDGPFFEATRSEFGVIVRSASYRERPVVEFVTHGELVIVKPSFKRSLKWYVIYNEIPMHVSIEDDEFWEKVEKRTVLFGKGDRLVVEMKVEQEYDPITNSYVPRNYVVTKVIDIIKATEQPNLPLD